MQKYKVGDRVKIKSDLSVGTWYGEDYLAQAMTPYLGEDATIVEVIGKDEYFLDVDQDDPWGWTAEMFE